MISSPPTPWALRRGARLQSDNSVEFEVWAPNTRAALVRVHGGPARGDHPMAPAGDGVFAARVPDVGADADYAFVLDEGREVPDPVSRWQPHGVHGASRVVDPHHAWTDEAWRGVPMEELLMYELHVGTFTPEGTFEAIIPRLGALKALGVTALSIMPVAQFPGERNWGYDGVSLYAVQDSYGGPRGFSALVDAAHAAGLGVILDVVYNHVGPEGNYLDVFGPYFTDKYKTPWGRALNYDDADSNEVRKFVVDNARFWVTEYHVDGLRLDAVHGIFDFSARHVLEEIASAVHDLGTQLDKSLVVIAESDLNDPKLLRSPGDRGFGLDAQWSDDFHHAVHALLTSESNGYYADFGGVAPVLAALREPFVYAGQYSRCRKRNHGAPSAGLPRRRFVAALQNHDQVGNRAVGDRLAALLTPAQLRLAAALLFWSPYVPLIFMGEEYGETNPFQYFVSHGDPELVAAVRDGRRKEFASFGWADDVPDPYDEATFLRSKIDWTRLEREEGDENGLGPHARIQALYRDLLALRREEPLLRPDAGQLSVNGDEAGWIAILREPPVRGGGTQGNSLLALFNCTAHPLDVPVLGVDALAWTLRLSTDAPGYGGAGEAEPVLIPVGDDPNEPKRLLGAQARTVRVPAWTASLYINYN